MKLREIREAYEDLSRTCSNTIRNLSISGIAISWLFMFKECVSNTSCFLKTALILFVLTLFFDLLQNFYLSIVWYIFYKEEKEKEPVNEDIEVQEQESNNTLGWLLYGLKLISLITGYILIGCSIFP